MTDLLIQLDSPTAAFAPGQSLSGTISWNRPEPPQKLTLALHWFTQSKAAEQSGMVDYLEIESPAPTGSADFSFQLPQGPYSFEGRLLSILWTLELAATPGHDFVRRPLILSPTARPLTLERLQRKYP